jgi:hypothetical protein
MRVLTHIEMAFATHTDGNDFFRTNAPTALYRFANAKKNDLFCAVFLDLVLLS